MNDVTRSGDADGAAAASYAARRRRASSNGAWGVGILVATETALFGTLVATYFFLRLQVSTWPPAGIEDPKVALPLVLTGALVATCIPMAVAAAAARAGRTRAAWLAILVATAIQCGYLAVQIVLYADDLDKFSPEDSAYGSIYFTMLAVHHAHVLVGILMCAWLLARLVSGITGHRLVAVRVVAIYWYFVSAMAVLVVLTQISPSL